MVEPNFGDKESKCELELESRVQIPSKGADQNQDKLALTEETQGQFLKRIILENYKPGLQVAMVSVPLSISLAIVSGGDPVQGLGTAIIAPFCQGLLGSSNHSVLGPAGALVNTLNAVASTNGPMVLPWIAFFTGIFNMIIFLLKLEKYSVYMPNSVLEGFTLGIATVISFSQIPFIFGLRNLKKHPHFYENVYEYALHLGDARWLHVVMTICSFLFLWYASKARPRIPWIFVLCVIGLIIGASCHGQSWAPDVLLDLYPSMSGTPNLFNFDHFSKWNSLPQGAIINGAIGAMVISVLETIITGRIAEQRTKVGFRNDQETFMLSVANFICGCLGCLTCTGVLVRTTININNFATHRMSTFINGVVTLIISLIFLRFFAYIPTPCIAGILIVAAVRMAPFSGIKFLWKKDKEQFFILFLVYAICIFLDGAIGLIVGIVVALLRNADKIAQDYIIVNTFNKECQMSPEIRLEPRKFPDMRDDFMDFVCKSSKVNEKNKYQQLQPDNLMLTVSGQLSYVNCEGFKSLFIKIMGDYKKGIVFSLKNVQFVDVDGMKFFNEVLQTMEKEKLPYCLVEPFHYECGEKFKSMEWYQKLDQKELVFENELLAMQKFAKLE